MTDSPHLPSATETPLVWWAKILGGDQEATLLPTSGSLAGPDETYFGLPNPNAPTMVIDCASREGLANAVASPGAGFARTTAGRMLRIPGFSKLVPRRLGLSSPGTTIREYLSEVVESDVVLSASCGPLRPNRKPVLRLLDGRGDLQAVAKVGWDPNTSELVATEAAAIRQVLATKPDLVVAPEVLAHDTWRGFEVLTVSPLAIDPAQGPELEPGRTLGAMHEVSMIERSTTALEDSGFIGRLYERLDGVASPSSDMQPLEVLEKLMCQGYLVDIGGFHGDWSPWNTQPLGGGRLLVWDWERFATDVPVGIDLVHYLFQVERFVNKSDPSDARDVVASKATALLADLDVDPDAADVLVTLYLLEAIARNSEGALSDQLADRRASLIAALAPRGAAGSNDRKVA